MVDVKQTNLLFKSDNLLAIKALHATHLNAIKCIYVDPPYNTGVNRKHFRDDRNSQEWGQMMRERLIWLKDLLKADGSIWISIDDSEICNLRAICNQVFGKENFLATVTWQHRINWDGYKGKFLLDHSYIVAYSRSSAFQFENNIRPTTVWLEANVGGHADATNESKKIFGDNNTFSTPKPERLMTHLLEITTKEEELVLDCFSGSGTTGAAAHKLGRQWIMMEIGDQCDTHIYPRLNKIAQHLDQNEILSYSKEQLTQGYFYFKDVVEYMNIVELSAGIKLN